MKAIDIQPAPAPDGRKVYRRRLIDEVQCTYLGQVSDFRRADMLRTFASQPDLWRIPSLGRMFETMKLKHVGGFWQIEIAAKEDKK